MDQLRRVAVFADLQDEDKVCLEGAEEKRIAKGENLVEEGKPAHNFFVLLEGEISVAKAYDGQQIVVARYRPGSFFGELPLLLGVPYILTARAESDCHFVVFAEEGFWRLLRLCPSIAAEIFRTMASRLRNLEGSSRQQEKLAALGTMSAGLAHELNNPSAAAQRIAAHLGDVIQAIQLVAHTLHQALEARHWDRLIGLVEGALQNVSTSRRTTRSSRPIRKRCSAIGSGRRAWPIRGRSLPCSSERAWIKRARFAPPGDSSERLQRRGAMGFFAFDQPRLAR